MKSRPGMYFSIITRGRDVGEFRGSRIITIRTSVWRDVGATSIVGTVTEVGQQPLFGYNSSEVNEKIFTLPSVSYSPSKMSLKILSERNSQVVETS